jgi:hypothetical protein
VSRPDSVHTLAARAQVEGLPLVSADRRLYDRFRRPAVSLAVLADENADWRPDGFGYQRWGCQVGIRFPAVKLLDYRKRWAELERSANPLAVDSPDRTT